MNTLPTHLTPDELRGTELFADLSPAALADVAASGRLRHLPKDMTVFVQGAPAERCHVLVGGRIRIVQSDGDGAQIVVRFIGPGEMFGTVGLFTDGAYPAEATTVLDSIEASWPESRLLELIDRHPRIGVNIVRILGRRIREVQERLRELATQRVERRIAHILLRLAAGAGKSDHGDGTTIDFPLGRNDIAEMCGATLHTISRVMTAWEKAGLVASGRQRVTIRDIVRIREIAEDLPA
jgi:CRP-like cAMP-binding protein